MPVGRPVYLVSVAVEDEPGMLAQVARALADGNINVDAFAADPAGIHLVTREMKPMKAAIEGLGFQTSVEEVHEIVLEDRPGALANICEALAAAGINIQSAFGMAAGFAGRIFVNVSDMPRAAPILEAASRRPVGPGANLKGAPPATAKGRRA